MTSRSDIEHVLDRYLAEGAEQVPDRVIDAALDQIDHIPQRRTLRAPWRSQAMPSVFKFAMAGAAVVAVLVVGSMLMSRGPTPDVGGPGISTLSPSPLASVPASALSPSPSLAITDTSNWVPFVSERYGYEIAHPPTWTVAPATRDWSLDSVDRTNWMGHGVADRFHESAATFAVLVTAFADDLPAGMSEDEWITAYFEPAGEPVEGCGTSSKDVRPITVDGHPGTLVNEQPCSDTIAVVCFDGRVHVFAVWRENQEALLESFLSQVKFQQ